MKKKKVIIFSHTDLDGVGTPFILEKMLKIVEPEKYEKKEFDVRLCSTGDYGNINTKIEAFMEKQHYFYDTVFLTDLTPSLEILTELVNFCVKKGIYLKVYDHHASQSSYAELFPNHVDIISELDGINQSASSLVFKTYDDMITEDKLSKITEKEITELNVLNKIADIIRSYDTWDWNKLADNKWGVLAKDFNTYFYYLNNSVFKLFLEEILEYNVKFYEDETLKFNNKYYNTIEVLNNLEDKHVWKNTLEDNLFFGEMKHNDITYKYVGCITDNYINTLSQKLYEKYVDCDFSLVINKDFVSLRSNKEDIDLGLLAKEKFNGGGHKSAAGFKILNMKSFLEENLI